MHPGSTGPCCKEISCTCINLRLLPGMQQRQLCPCCVSLDGRLVTYSRKTLSGEVMMPSHARDAERRHGNSHMPDLPARTSQMAYHAGQVGSSKDTCMSLSTISDAGNAEVLPKSCAPPLDSCARGKAHMKLIQPWHGHQQELLNEAEAGLTIMMSRRLTWPQAWMIDQHGSWLAHGLNKSDL